MEGGLESQHRRVYDPPESRSVRRVPISYGRKGRENVGAVREPPLRSERDVCVAVRMTGKEDSFVVYLGVLLVYDWISNERWRCDQKCLR